MTSYRLASLALFVLAACCAASAQSAQPGEIEWHKDFKKARELAMQSGKPLMVDFTADWCKPCKEMERSFWPKPEIVELSKKFVCVSLNFDHGGPEVSRYRVDRIPAVVFTDPWGNQLTKKFGFGNNVADVLPQIMQLVPADFSALYNYNAVLERDKDNAAALTKVGDFYRRNGIIDLSTEYFKRALKTKELAADRDARGELLIAVAINYLKIKEYGDAKKYFEDYLKEFPKGKHGDTALLGVITAQVNKKKLGEAEKTFEQLKADYADSPVVGQASALLQQAKSQKN